MSREIVESEEFYNLMQFYRHMPIVRQKEVVKAYEAVRAHIERLLAQERKKVRERCAKQAESWNDTTDWMKARQRLPFRVAASIRQLDLTKPESNLAASSREEGEKSC